MELKIKRVYETPSANDGTRILVDRLWPRGISREKGKIDIWLKEIAPSNELRKWYGMDPGKWEEFKMKYTAELEKLDEPVSILREEIIKGTVTLLYAKKDSLHNHAQILKEFMGM
ncbi:MAG: DUF488 domain-containing protein [Ignavibacteria bacterium]|jgi:uncharacterized protein YeaO (DUF488 family)|nr:DUF488 domain-containing protein [Ignavibacteria bacterium]